MPSAAHPAFPLLDAPWQPDPYPFYAALRRQHRDMGLFHDDASGLWVACTPVAVHDVLHTPGLHVRPADEPVPRALSGRPSGAVFGALMRMNDGEQHHLAPKRVALDTLAALLPRIDDAAQALYDVGWRPGEQDLNALLALAPVAVLAAATGADVAQAQRVAHDTRALVSAWQAGADDTHRTLGDAAAERLLAHCGGDANRVGFFTQTCDATAGLLGNALVALQRGGEATADAADTLSLVRETAARDPSVHNTRRFAHEAVSLCGRRLPAGATVLVLLAAAGQPFGGGPHACPGERLAQQIASALLTRWRRSDTWRIASARWRYRRLPNARIPEFLQEAA